VDWPDPRAFHQIIYEVSVAARNVEHAIERPDWIEPTLMRMILNSGRISAIEHHRALLARTTFYNAVRRFFEDYDLLLTPQMPLAAWSAEPGAYEGVHEIDGRPAPTMFDRLPFMYPFNLTGYPAASVPCGFTHEGLPVAIQIAGRWHADAQVLRAAACFEAIQPWAQHRPPLD
jgi:Asp-tRNA(Asn)/Glu-tRNA(Gln) amidotransferase A subunit family amidase